ncbi:hypothetical protein Efla_001889 [Eimeria flavescens]
MKPQLCCCRSGRHHGVVTDRQQQQQQQPQPQQPPAVRLQLLLLAFSLFRPLLASTVVGSTATEATAAATAAMAHRKLGLQEQHEEALTRASNCGSSSSSSNTSTKRSCSAIGASGKPTCKDARRSSFSRNDCGTASTAPDASKKQSHTNSIGVPGKKESAADVGKNSSGKEMRKKRRKVSRLSSKKRRKDVSSSTSSSSSSSSATATKASRCVRRGVRRSSSSSGNNESEAANSSNSDEDVQQEDQHQEDEVASDDEAAELRPWPPTAGDLREPSCSRLRCLWQQQQHQDAADRRLEALCDAFCSSAIAALQRLKDKLAGVDPTQAAAAAAAAVLPQVVLRRADMLSVEETSKEQDGHERVKDEEEQQGFQRQRQQPSEEKHQQALPEHLGCLACSVLHVLPPSGAAAAAAVAAGQRLRGYYELQQLSVSSWLRRFFLFLMEETLELVLYSQGFTGASFGGPWGGPPCDASATALRFAAAAMKQLRPLVSLYLLPQQQKKQQSKNKKQQQQQERQQRKKVREALARDKTLKTALKRLIVLPGMQQHGHYDEEAMLLLLLQHREAQQQKLDQKEEREKRLQIEREKHEQQQQQEQQQDQPIGADDTQNAAASKEQPQDFAPAEPSSGSSSSSCCFDQQQQQHSPETHEVEEKALQEVKLEGHRAEGDQSEQQYQQQRMWGEEMCLFLRGFQSRREELRREIAESPHFLYFVRFLNLFSSVLGVTWTFSSLLDSLVAFSPPADVLLCAYMLSLCSFEFDPLTVLQQIDLELAAEEQQQQQVRDDAAAAAALSYVVPPETDPPPTARRTRQQQQQQQQQRAAAGPRVGRQQKKRRPQQQQLLQDVDAAPETADTPEPSLPQTPTAAADAPQQQNEDETQQEESLFQQHQQQQAVSGAPGLIRRNQGFLQFCADLAQVAAGAVAAVTGLPAGATVEGEQMGGSKDSSSSSLSAADAAAREAAIAGAGTASFWEWEATGGEEDFGATDSLQRLLQRMLILLGRKASFPFRSARAIRRLLQERGEADYFFPMRPFAEVVEAPTDWAHLKPVQRLRFLRVLISIVLSDSPQVARQVAGGIEEAEFGCDGLVGEDSAGRLYWLVCQQGDPAVFKLYREDFYLRRYELLSEDLASLEAIATSLDTEEGMGELSHQLLQQYHLLLQQQRQRSREERRRKAVERQLETAQWGVVTGRRERKPINYLEVEGEVDGQGASKPVNTAATREERWRARLERKVMHQDVEQTEVLMSQLLEEPQGQCEQHQKLEHPRQQLHSEQFEQRQPSPVHQQIESTGASRVRKVDKRTDLTSRSKATQQQQVCLSNSRRSARQQPAAPTTASATAAPERDAAAAALEGQRLRLHNYKQQLMLLQQQKDNVERRMLLTHRQLLALEQQIHLSPQERDVQTAALEQQMVEEQQQQRNIDADSAALQARISELTDAIAAASEQQHKSAPKQEQLLPREASSSSSSNNSADSMSSDSKTPALQALAKDRSRQGDTSVTTHVKEMGAAPAAARPPSSGEAFDCTPASASLQSQLLSLRGAQQMAGSVQRETAQQLNGTRPDSQQEQGQHQQQQHGAAQQQQEQHLYAHHERQAEQQEQKAHLQQKQPVRFQEEHEPQQQQEMLLADNARAVAQGGG